MNAAAFEYSTTPNDAAINWFRTMDFERIKGQLYTYAGRLALHGVGIGTYGVVRAMVIVISERSGDDGESSYTEPQKAYRRELLPAARKLQAMYAA